MTFGVVIELGTGALLLYGVPFVIVVGWFSSRILGVHRGWGRSLVAGFVGWIVGVAVAAVVQDQNIRNTGQLERRPLLAFFVGLLVSMFVGLGLDILLKPKVRKRRRYGPILHPIATSSASWRPSVARVRFSATPASVGSPGCGTPRPQSWRRRSSRARLRLTLEDCGGMFVKFGQIASTRTDLLPEVLTTELALLQSSARPVPADEVREVIESELGATVEEEFASFDFEPLAAASIGQTHRAVLKTGERVVVKVQRPGIEDIVHRDAAVLRMAAGVVERRVEAARQIGVKRLAGELIASLERELDYGAEAASGEAFLEHLDDDAGIAAPHVYQALSTRRVLVMEEIDGVTVADHDAVDGITGRRRTRWRRDCSGRSSTRCCATACTTPTRTRGTSSSTAEGTLWFLDFGAVGRLSPVDPRVDAGDGDRLPAERPGRAGARAATARGRRRVQRQPGARGRHRARAHARASTAGASTPRR